MPAVLLDARTSQECRVRMTARETGRLAQRKVRWSAPRMVSREIAVQWGIGNDRGLMRTGVLLLAPLAGLAFLVALTPMAAAPDSFGGARSEPDGGGARRPGPPSRSAAPTEPGPGEYSLDFDQVLEAINRGEGRQALAYYERVAGDAEQQGNRALAARAYGAASAAALRLGLFQKAIQSGTQSIELFKSAELELDDLPRWAAAYSQVGTAYRQVGNLAQARKVLEEGLAFAETRLGGLRSGVAVGYLSNSLALVAYAQQDYQTALERATQAAQFLEGASAHPPRRAPERHRVNMRRLAAMSLVSVGRAQLALGHPNEAEAAFDRAHKYARSVGLREIDIEIAQGQGVLALSRQDWSRALGVYQQGIALANQIKQTGALMWLNHGLARALSGLGRIDEALAAAREAVRYVEELRGELGASDLRSGFVEGKQGIYQEAIRLALQAQHPAEAFALAEGSRARAFLDLLGSQTTLSKGRTRGLVDAEVRLRARLAQAQAQASLQDTGGTEESERAQALIDADRDYRAFLDRVRKESLEQASLMTVEPVTLPEIQVLLPEGTTLLEYLISEGEVITWVVDRQHAKVVRVPGDRQALVREVRGFRAAVVNEAPLADVQTRADALYRRLVGPARSEIHGDRLLIVAHGVLHYLPFAALRSPAGRWLVEDFALGTLPSASVLRYMADKGTGASAPALVVGNPDVGAGLALRWAEREARMVGQHERGATVLTRGDATEVEVKKLLETAGLAHFATHGELSESDPLSSALLLVPGGGEDGRLEVRELFGLDLRARLVVLSACETGLGKLSRGDELVGLQRAFLYAGAPAVVTTLWKVDDRASYELIRAFYDRLEQAGPVGSLRQAQLEIMRTFPQPFAWAGFGATGVPR
jgi:CHAT domain-containing protein